MVANNILPLEQNVRHIHFVGIGGSGMSGIAEVLINQGYYVTGSDLTDTKTVKYLQKIGAKIFHGHDAANITGADIIVLSSAIAMDNPEIVAARQARIPLVPRAQMLAEIMREKEGIAIAGTHGKTTTTSLVASILAEGGLDPTFVIGGLLNSSGTNAQLGKSQYFVAEADESDASFLFLKPKIAIVTNIDADHLWSYEGDFQRLRKTFLEFIHHLPLTGLAVLCIDDPTIREILPEIGRPFLTYGFSDDADFHIHDFTQTGVQSNFKIKMNKNDETLVVNLNLAGMHNAANATAAIVVAKELGIHNTAINNALMNFKGVGRRFQLRGHYPFSKGKALLVDDYDHHPREIAATIAAARVAWPERRLVLAFQPHRYTRTKSLFEDFTQVLSSVDQLILLDTYAAGENPIVGYDGRSLCGAIRQRGQVDPIFLSREDKIEDILENILQDNDILLLQGAGDVGAMATRLVPFIN